MWYLILPSYHQIFIEVAKKSSISKYEEYARLFLKMSDIEDNEDRINSSSKRLSEITILKYVQIFTYSSFLGVSIVLLIVQTIQSLKVYIEGPTYTETLLHRQQNTTFPMVTVCPLENGYKEDILKVIVIWMHCIYYSFCERHSHFYEQICIYFYNLFH